jgi:hypothetical protein
LTADAANTPNSTSKTEPVVTVSSPVSQEIFPQIARISYVEGDVRIARGKEAERTTHASWETAVNDLPVETGFSLATGAGRAEIEFEDASTVYLAENSVLTFNDLHSQAGIPYTELALLTGTATMHVRPESAQERFVVHTPADTVRFNYPVSADIRVDSYLDAMGVTALKDIAVQPGATEARTVVGKTSFYRDGHVVTVEDAKNTEDHAEWDHWVANRVAERTAATTAVMKEAGLSQPIPGLAEMNHQGTFFPCEPYGTCWEPKGLEDEEDLASTPAATPASGSGEGAHALEASAVQPTAVSGAAAPATPGRRRVVDDPFIGCLPRSVRMMMLRNPGYMTAQTSSYQLDPRSYRYNWAVCHAGAWVRHRRHYAWAVGTRRHHHPPVHFVKGNGKVLIVPVHPNDSPGKRPLNLEHEVFVLSDKKNMTVEPFSLKSGKVVEVLASAPKEFQKPNLTPLARAQAPQLEARLVKDGLAPRSATEAKPAATTLIFDRRSQSFVLAKQVMQDGRTTTVHQAFHGNSGNLQARAGGVTSHGGYSGGSSGGSSAGRSSGSGGVGSSGGGFHGGGSVASSGGSSGVGGGAGSGGGHH